jgi:hypothetical protein
VSDEVWQEIAKRGKFGETEDDVLRKVFKVPSNPPGPLSDLKPKSPVRGRFAVDKMHARVYDGPNGGQYLKVLFYGSGAEQIFNLQRDKSDKRCSPRRVERGPSVWRDERCVEGTALRHQKGADRCRVSSDEVRMRRTVTGSSRSGPSCFRLPVERVRQFARAGDQGALSFGGAVTRLD